MSIRRARRAGREFYADGGTMAEEKQQQPQPGGAPPEPGQEERLRAELARTRAGNKLLKIAAVVLASLFVIMAAAVFYIYSRVSEAAKGLDAIQSYLPPPSGYTPENRSIPAPSASLFGAAASSGSGLGLFSGSVPDESRVAVTAEDAQKVAGAFSRYSDRPVVKEFIADMKKDPELAKVLAHNKDANPLSVLASIQKSPRMQALAAKYALRPDFIKLVMEVYSDPALKPMMQHMPGVMPQLPGALPQPAQAPAAPEAAPQQDQPEDSGPMTLDTSVISGGASEQPAQAAPKTVPPPVDNQ